MLERIDFLLKGLDIIVSREIIKNNFLGYNSYKESEDRLKEVNKELRKEYKLPNLEALPITPFKVLKTYIKVLYNEGANIEDLENILKSKLGIMDIEEEGKEYIENNNLNLGL